MLKLWILLLKIIHLYRNVNVIFSFNSVGNVPEFLLSHLTIHTRMLSVSLFNFFICISVAPLKSQAYAFSCDEIQNLLNRKKRGENEGEVCDLHCTMKKKKWKNKWASGNPTCHSVCLNGVIVLEYWCRMWHVPPAHCSVRNAGLKECVCRNVSLCAAHVRPKLHQSCVLTKHKESVFFFFFLNSVSLSLWR